MSIEDLDALAKESKKSKAMGFNGKAAIHPSQLEVIRSSFIPNAQEIEEAKEIIKAFDNSSSAVIAFKGKMIDKPVILSMEKRLRLVGIDPKNID
jgi:citrate lyase beta subunit